MHVTPGKMKELTANDQNVGTYLLTTMADYRF